MIPDGEVNGADSPMTVPKSDVRPGQGVGVVAPVSDQPEPTRPSAPSGFRAGSIQWMPDVDAVRSERRRRRRRTPGTGKDSVGGVHAGDIRIFEIAHVVVAD